MLHAFPLPSSSQILIAKMFFQLLHLRQPARVPFFARVPRGRKRVNQLPDVCGQVPLQIHACVIGSDNNLHPRPILNGAGGLMQVSAE
jgi:hypothetical protein